MIFVFPDSWLLKTCLRHLLDLGVLMELAWNKFWTLYQPWNVVEWHHVVRPKVFIYFEKKTQKTIPFFFHFFVFLKGTEQEQALLDLQQVHDNNALIGRIKKPMLSREGTVDSEMLDFATENITTLHPDDSAEVVDSNGAEGNEMFRMTIKYKGLKKN